MKKVEKSNFHVKVYPRAAGDFGLVRISGYGIKHSEEEALSLCEEIARDIRRHVDGLPSYGNRGVIVDYDIENVCSYCGQTWESDNETYNNGCCSKDDENIPLEENINE